MEIVLRGLLEARNIHELQLNPTISKFMGNEKKFEIAGFRNNRGKVKFVTMNHFFFK